MAETLAIVHGVTKGCECRASRVRGWLGTGIIRGSVRIWLRNGNKFLAGPGVIGQGVMVLIKDNLNLC